MNNAESVRAPGGHVAKGFGLWLGILVLAFAKPLYDLAVYAGSDNSELYSHILLIPFISLYLVWCKRDRLALDSDPVRRYAVFPALAAALVLAGYWFAVSAGWKIPKPDYLAAMVLACLGLLLTGAFLTLGGRTVREVAFPMGLLIFMAPFPKSVLAGIELGLQHGSAFAAALFFKVAGMSFLREGTLFQLPGFAMQVAPECSGIHSTLVLLITSLLAGHLFLRSGWTKATLAVAVIPLALLRNGLRIFVIGELCVNISPDMINSYIHRRGGPIFFALSLIPFFALLVWLRRLERARRPGPPGQSE